MKHITPFVQKLSIYTALSFTIGTSQGVVTQLIGGSLRNGNLDDISGAMQFDPPATTAIADTDANNTRASNSNSAANSSVTIPFWTAQRSVALDGGNAFFGFDDGTGTPITSAGDLGFLYNNGEVAGAVDLISDSFATGLLLDAGSIFTLSFQISTDDADSDVLSLPILTVGGSAIAADSIALSSITGTASTDGLTSITVSGADSFTTATAIFTLASAASDSVQLTFDNSSVVDSSGVDRASINNITLQVETVPEPSTAILGGLAALGLLRRRRS